MPKVKIKLMVDVVENARLHCPDPEVMQFVCQARDLSCEAQNLKTITRHYGSVYPHLTTFIERPIELKGSFEELCKQVEIIMYAMEKHDLTIQFIPQSNDGLLDQERLEIVRRYNQAWRDIRKKRLA